MENQNSFQHLSVLLNETIDSLNIRPDKIYIDATAGGAGHSCEIAKRLTTGRLIAIDQDPDAVAVATARLSPYSCAQVVKGNFRDLLSILKTLELSRVDGILMDLGVSSHQLDCVERGFSYHNDAPLDMRMSQQGLCAKDVVNEYSERDLTRIFREYGEEKFATRVSRSIVEKRAVAPIDSTTQLADIIKFAIPAATRREGGHPAKRCFQAIRIEVNGELEVLKTALDDAFSALAPEGRLSVITFHSLEDRMVKHNFQRHCVGCTCPPKFPICICGKTPAAKLPFRKPISATEEELLVNKRSRSAKLRSIEKIKDE